MCNKRRRCKEITKKDQDEIKIIRDLCEQFKSADMYVIAAPMWSLSFPAPLKEYIDCVVLVGKTITFEKGKKPQGLLNDKYRALVYVESAGGNIPLLLDPIMDKGENYISSIMKTLGIKKVHEIKVDNTGTTEEERKAAINKAENEIDHMINSLEF